MFVNTDFSDLLNLFKANNVKYMVIGEYAVVQYTEPRFTKDLDLWISTHPDNAEQAKRAAGRPQDLLDAESLEQAANQE